MSKKSVTYKTEIMNTKLILILTLFITQASSCQNMDTKKFNKLTAEEQYVILQKGTERPWTGEYVDFKEEGIYVCRQCNAPLYRSSDKFDSHCGWPSFDDEIPGAVKRQVDADGYRTEILCANCGGHLGHVFEGEEFTEKNVRHCVNSISLNFVPQQNDSMQNQVAIYAGGCFWGMEYLFNKVKGVLNTTVGYTGGDKENPTYEEVCSHSTGHAEVIQVEFDPSVISYEELTKYFFEIHDPTQVNRQGPDIGEQYRSEIFYFDDQQRQTAEKLIKILEDKGYDIATRLTPATTFYPAEGYHQDYYEKGGGRPYCHVYRKRF